MEPLKILVTGADGQLGKTFIELHKSWEHNFDLTFTNKESLDITDTESIKSVFSNQKFDYCINCSAYTSVDKAEEEVEEAYSVNSLGVKNLALACSKFNTVLIHISTDFVFDGKSSKPYTEEDEPGPTNVYGDTKLAGEKSIMNCLDEFFIIRTSWLYSEFGKNFVKTMLNLAETKNELSVVSDQIGTPTYAKDLAKMIFSIISSKSSVYGIYNYSSLGQTSWHELAQEVFRITNKKIKVNPILTKDYPTLAKRPRFSVLDKGKIINIFNVTIPKWQDRLETVIKILNER